jgi:hypothetical protein
VEDVLAHPEEPWTATIEEQQVIPTWEQVYKKYKQLEKMMANQKSR